MYRTEYYSVGTNVLSRAKHWGTPLLDQVKNIPTSAQATQQTEVGTTSFRAANEKDFSWLAQPLLAHLNQSATPPKRYGRQ